MLNFPSIDVFTCSFIKLNWAREDTYALYCEKDFKYFKGDVARLKQMCSNSKRTTSEELKVVKHQVS